MRTNFQKAMPPLAGQHLKYYIINNIVKLLIFIIKLCFYNIIYSKKADKMMIAGILAGTVKTMELSFLSEELLIKVVLLQLQNLLNSTKNVLDGKILD